MDKTVAEIQEAVLNEARSIYSQEVVEEKFRAVSHRVSKATGPTGMKCTRCGRPLKRGEIRSHLGPVGSNTWKRSEEDPRPDKLLYVNRC